MNKVSLSGPYFLKKSRHKHFFRIMRIASFLLFVLIFSLHAVNSSSQNTRITVRANNTSLKEVLNTIEKQTDYLFVYNTNVNTNQNVGVNAVDQPVNQVLDNLFKQIGLSYVKEGSYIVVSAVAGKTSTNQQKKRVQGTVTDTNGEPIIGANVVEKGTTNGTITDLDGKFSLEITPGASLQVSYIGYNTKDIVVSNDQSILAINLSEDSQAIDEVVVVAFGTQKKANLTAAVAAVDAAEIAERPVANLSQALQGVSPGLNITANNMGGALNETPNIDIRGTGTIGEGSKSAPLILIDGVPGDMNMINMQDVENISILKDGASAAIYGSRAAFGVVLITTKSGKKGKVTVNYNNNFRWSTPTKLPSFVNSYDFAQYFNEVAKNSGLGNFYSDEVLQKTKDYMEGKIDYSTDYDDNGVWLKNMQSWGNTEWFGVYYKDWSFSQEHNVSINGGSDAMQYYISANYQGLGSDQNYGNEDYKRYTLNGKINANPFSWLKINYNMKFSRKNYNAPTYQTNSVYYHSMPRRRPSNSVYTPDGVFNKESQLNEMENGGDYTDDLDILYQQMSLIIEPVKNWQIFMEGNMRIDREDIHKDWKVIKERKEDGSYFNMDRDDGMGGRSRVEEAAQKTNYLNSNIYSKYLFTLGEKHNFNVMGGFQAEINKYKDISAGRDGMISESVPSLGNTTSETTYSLNSALNEWATVGFFASVNYDYDGKYLLEVKYRYDGSSRFLRDKRWNHYPSVSAAWNIARESFMEPANHIINTWKIRGSYANLGNQNTNEIYPFYSSMGLGVGNGSWLINYKRPNIANPPQVISPTLTWETVTSYDLGMDVGLFKNRLTGTADYFWRYTNDMVAPGEELPNTAGVASPYTNNARMLTKGWELTLSWRDRLSSGLGYGASFVLADAMSEILSYPNSTLNVSRYYKGQKLGEIWGYETNGLARTEEQMKNHLASLPNGGQDALGSNWAAGDIMYKDLNGDGKIDGGQGVLGNTGDLTVIGNKTPRYNFGLTLDADYKGFDLRVFFQGTMKQNAWLTGLYMYGADGGYWQSTALKETMDYFRPADTDSYFGPNTNGYLPRPLLGASANNNKAKNSLYLQNAAYMRCKNIQLGYTFDKDITSFLGLQNLRMYLSAENLFVISGLKADAYDPEVLNGYGDGSGKASPLKATISFGLNITL